MLCKMNLFLLSQNFAIWKSDLNVHLKHNGIIFLIILLYADDLLITGSSPSSINTIKTTLQQAFDMSNLGMLNSFFVSKSIIILMGS